MMVFTDHLYTVKGPGASKAKQYSMYHADFTVCTVLIYWDDGTWYLVLGTSTRYQGTGTGYQVSFPRTYLHFSVYRRIL